MLHSHIWTYRNAKLKWHLKINAIHHIHRTKKKNHKVISRNEKKIVFMNKFSANYIYKKKKNPTANVICYGLWLNVFSGRMGQREGCSRPSLLINKKGKILVMVGTHVKQRI